MWVDPKRHPAPTEYTTLVLCRDVYHCTPSQLRQESAEDVLAALLILDVENQVSKRRALSQTTRDND